MQERSVQIGDLGNYTIVSRVEETGCVDPRKQGLLVAETPIPPTHSVGAERTPGASAGIVMTLIGALPKLAVDTAIISVDLWERHQGRRFTIHNDDHHGEAGCGHLDKATLRENEALYGVPSDKVATMRGKIFELAEEGMIKINNPTLTGDHRERGVAVVHSFTETVDPTNDQHELFRFDAKRHTQSLANLAQFLNTYGIKVSPDHLVAVAERQRGATLSLLAPGKDVYDVFPAKQRSEHKGKVPPADIYKSMLQKLD